MQNVHEIASGTRSTENWKRALMLGTFGAAAYFLFTDRRPAGFALAGVGLAVLASEHPEKFQEVWDRAPEYLEKGQRLIQNAGGLFDKITEQASKFQSSRGRRSEHDYLT